MSKRKIHNEEPGYVAEKMNPWVPFTKVVIHDLKISQPEYPGPMRCSVFCDAHKTNTHAPSIAKARELMKNPGLFCDECRVISNVAAMPF